MSRVKSFRNAAPSLLIAASVLLGVRPSLAQTGCGLDSRNQRNVVLPAIANGTMPPALASEIERGFDQLFVKFETASGEQALVAALADATSSGNSCAAALAHFGLGLSGRDGDLSVSREHFREAEKLLKGVGTPLALAHIHQRIAITEHLLGNNETFPREDPDVQAEFHNGGDEAMAIMEKSLALQYAANGQHPAEQLALLHELDAVQTANVTAVRGFIEWEVGSSLRRTGRYAEIKQHFDAALAALAECDCGYGTRAAILLSTAAAFDSGNDGESVLFYARQADEIYTKHHMEAERVQSLRLIAAGYAHQHDWTRAIATNTTALQLAEDRHNAVFAATVGLELADNYGSAGKAARGLEILSSTALPHPTQEQLCNQAAQRTVLEQEAALWQEAEADGSKVLSGCRELLQPNIVARVDVSLAVILLHQNRAEESLVHSQDAARIIESQRDRLQPTDRALRAYNERNAAAYNALISAYIQLRRPEDGLLASEQFRARAFFDLASSRSSAPLAMPPANSAARLPEAPATGTTRKDARSLPGLQSEAHPVAITMDGVRGLIAGTHSTLVSYWLAEDGKLYTWVLTPGKPVTQTTHQVEPAKLAALVQATLPSTDAGARRSLVATRGGENESLVAGSRQPWHELYRILLAPIADQLPKEAGSLLTIVPQGVLFQLSFPALMDEHGRYLIEQYAIHTVPSVRTLQLTSRNETASAAMPPHYLLVANSEQFPKVEGHALPQLPGTALEVKRIQEQLHGAPVTVLEGKRAGINTLIDALPTSTVVHISTHAVVRDDAPMASFLALDRSQRGGILTARELYELHLHADLVVLSACSTGRGAISGDGVAGLSRAFLSAGTASLVATLWDVVDEPTADFMPRFYASLAKGNSRSAALRDAQISLIQDLRHHRIHVKSLSQSTVSLPERPAFWAAFSLIGEP